MSESSDRIVPLTSEARSEAREFGVKHDRQFLTILFTDLVGSTMTQSELGNAEAARLTEIHRKIVREELASYDAREIEWAGDSCLAVFTKPSDAVTFALRMQAEHRRVRASEPNLPQVRTGIHMGEIVVKRRDDGGKKTEDLFGLQVSETARIMSLARPNQILCSPAVFENARNALRGAGIDDLGAVVWLEHGRYELAGVDRPVEICEVGENEFAPLQPPEDSEKCHRVPVDTRIAQPTRSSGWQWGVAFLALMIGVIAAALYAASVVNQNRNAVDPESAEDIALIPPDAEPSKPVQRILMSLRPEHPLIAPEFSNVPLAISPDGSSLVYIANIDGSHMLVYRPMGELESRILPGTEDASNPTFSPDGRWVAFIAHGQLKKTSVVGGVPVPLAECIFPNRIDWTEDDQILYSPSLSAGVHRIASDGSSREQLTEVSPEHSAHPTPSALPGNKGILYSAAKGPQVRTAQLRLLPFDGGPETVLAEGAVYAKYLPTGHIVYAQEGRLAAIPFDLEMLEPRGPAQVVPEEYITEDDMAPTHFDVSEDGTLVYIPGGGPSEIQSSRELVWVDRDGNEETIPAPSNKVYYAPRVSPDGRYIATGIIAAATGTDIWLYEIERAALSRVTSHPATDTVPAWLADGRIIFSSARDGSVFNLYTVRPNAVVPPERLTFNEQSLLAPTGSPDGQEVFASLQTQETGYDVARIPLDNPSEIRILIQTPDNEGNAVLSPDGRYLAYSALEGGRTDVYVSPYPDLDQKILVSSDGGRGPCWSPDGSELYYRNGDKMMAVAIELDPKLRVGKPELLFEKPFFTDPLLSRSYDVSPVDGRFLILRGVPHTADATPNQIVVVTNWFEELKRLVPAPETP